MIKKVADNLWIPFWVDKWIFGSMRIEFEPAERAIWVDLLALAAKDDGWIRANEETPYLLTQLAGLLVYPEDLFSRAIEKFIEKGKIERDSRGILRIISWEKYCGSKEYRRKLKERHLKSVTPGVTECHVDRDKSVTHITSHHIISDHNNIKSEEKTFGPLFEELWKQWPAEGRFKKKYCRMKFLALCRQGKLEDFKKTARGYSDYLRHKKENENFAQQPMHLSTFLNNWEEEKDRYIGFKYQPRL